MHKSLHDISHVYVSLFRGTSYVLFTLKIMIDAASSINMMRNAFFDFKLVRFNSFLCVIGLVFTKFCERFFAKILLKNS